MAEGLATNAEGLATKAEQRELMPTLYIPHGGGPCFYMDWDPVDTWDGMASWLRQLSSTLPNKPKALLVISAHWEEAEHTVTTAAQPTLLYDYYGFPKHTYEIQYPVSGAPELAQRVGQLLSEAQIGCRSDDARGLDHGVFVPLKLVFPDADIPIVQLSLKRGLKPEDHLALGRALAPLRAEGVLIVGSGMSFHNIRHFGHEGAKDSLVFDRWLYESVCNSDHDERISHLKNWEQAPSARASHPREEHLIPLMVAMGAAGEDVATRIYSDLVMSMAISGYQFG